MSRTDLDPATIARAARRMAGDGSIEWVMEPIQASVLLDIADALDESAKLRVERDEWHRVAESKQDIIDHMRDARAENAKLREELDQWHSLTAGIELTEYPITQFQPKDLERENAKLREMLAENNEELAKMRRVIDYLYSFAKSCGVDAEDMRELGVEVDG